MLRFFVLSLLMCGTVLVADEPGTFKLAAPEGWGGETIQLPPGFAPDMKLKGSEHIRFAPGMMKPKSDSFFCYAFVFEVQPQPVLTEAVLKEEFLKYFRGLCKSVLNGKLPDVDPSEFTLELQRVKSDAKPALDEQNAMTPAQYIGTLNWVEPFATKKPQKLNLEIWTWTKGDRNDIFACVSPQARGTEIWKQLREIRDGYLKTQASHAQTTAPDNDGWYRLFDGKSLDGWKAGEEPKAFKVEDGLIVAGSTNLTHLYYAGPVQNAKFKNFELKAEVKTRPQGNSGIFYHTEYQLKGIPKGFEFQINNTGSDKRYRTGAIYPAKPLDRVVAKDDEWFECHLIVVGNKVVQKVNGETTMDVELPLDAKSGLTLASGMFAIQSHDLGSIVYFRSLRVKPLE